MSNDLCNQSFHSLLSEFKAINHESKRAQSEYDALKEKVKNSNELTTRQLEMLMYRLNNWQEYHAPKIFYSQQKPEKK